MLRCSFQTYLARCKAGTYSRQILLHGIQPDVPIQRDYRWTEEFVCTLAGKGFSPLTIRGSGRHALLTTRLTTFERVEPRRLIVQIRFSTSG